MRPILADRAGLARVALSTLRRQLRASEAAIILLAVLIGAAAGLSAVIQGALARTLQHWLFALSPGQRLSGVDTLTVASLAALPIGGVVLVAFNRITRARERRMVDAVEANALHGGRMSASDSLVVSGQTIISNGFGASVGLEAAFAQTGGAIGSIAGGVSRLRRSDRRALVGAGSGAAIAAAFGAPLTGAFYAFEIVIGAYTPATVAPVAAAALSGVLVAQLLGQHPYLVDVALGSAVHAGDYPAFVLLGALCAGLGIALMRAVTLVERATRAVLLPRWWRPVAGSFLLIPLAMVSPQALSAGHGALNLDLAVGVPLGALLIILVVKSAASIVSLGFGFRGGLFFASLFLGSLIGQLYADLLALVAGHVVVDPQTAAMVGMAAFAVAVVGGPMTMAMLVLEATHDFSLTGAVIAAALVSSSIVRETFGYSFSTWRLHLRGETVRTARDIGWMETMTAGSLMRPITKPVPATMTIADFRRAFPIGSSSRAVLTDANGRFVGMIVVPMVYADGLESTAPVSRVATTHAVTVNPEDDSAKIMRKFDHVGVDELAVVDADMHVLGLVSESHVRRRYAEELEKAQRELFGER